MANLNLRERVIETTIAYVSAHADGGATNFAHVQQEVTRGKAGALEETALTGGRMLSLEWRPRTGTKLNDCDIRVKLIAPTPTPDGKLEDDAVRHVLVDADGFVLVLDADPAAEAANRRAVSTIHEALSRREGKPSPVVVQVNQRGETALLLPMESLDVHADWPQLLACSGKGEGVMETLQRAVDVVVESMQKPKDGEPKTVRPLDDKARTRPRVEGNPLLSALRQILETTVSERVDTLEKQLLSRLERANAPDPTIPTKLAAIEARLGRIEAAATAQARSNTTQLEDLAARIKRVEPEIVRAETVAEGRTRLLATQLEEVTTRMKRGELENTRRICELQEAIGQLGKQLDAELAIHVGELQAAVTQQTKLLEASTARRVTALQDSVTQQGKQREADGARQMAELQESLGLLTQRLDGSIAHRLDVVHESVSLQLEKLDASLTVHASDLETSMTILGKRTDGVADATRAAVESLADELKKKKSWFG